ncbi:MAG: hypothetical protein ACOYOT_03810 [Bacteroidales bacterium]
MNDKLIVSSEIKNYKFYWIAFFCFSGLFGCYLLYKLAFSGVYMDLIAFTFATIILSFVIYGIARVLRLYKIEIYEDHIIINPIFGSTKTILNNHEISSWIEIRKESKNDVWYVLTIFTPDYQFKVSSATYKNYPKLKNALTLNKFNDVEKERKVQSSISRRASYFFLSISFIFLFPAYFSFMGKDIDLTKKDLTTIQEVVISGIKVNTGSKGARSITLRLLYYPEFRFNISGDAFHATYADFFVNTVYPGDTLLVDIKSEDYKKKIAYEEEMSFFDKTVGYSNINVYGLRCHNNSYLTIDDYNKHKNRFVYLLFVFLVLFFLFFGIFLYKKANKQLLGM